MAPKNSPHRARNLSKRERKAVSTFVDHDVQAKVSYHTMVHKIFNLRHEEGAHEAD